MSATFRPRGTAIDRIEMAIARGESPERICREQGVTLREVESVRRHMDAAVADSPMPVMGGKP